MMKLQQRTKAKAEESLPTANQRNREAVERTIKRSTGGNVQIAHGKVVTPKDKSLGKLDKI